MAAASFPPSLPNPNVSDFRESDIDTNLQDGNDLGLYNARATTTKVIRKFSFSLWLTDTQRAALVTFYDTTIGKVQIFNWTHPVTAEVIEAKFDRRPQFSVVADDFHIARIEITEV